MDARTYLLSILYVYQLVRVVGVDPRGIGIGFCILLLQALQTPNVLRILQFFFESPVGSSQTSKQVFQHIRLSFARVSNWEVFVSIL